MKKQTFEQYLMGEPIAKSSVKDYLRYMNRINTEVFGGKLVIDDYNSTRSKEDIKADVDKMKSWLDEMVNIRERTGNKQKGFDRNTLIPYYSAIKNWLRYIGFVSTWKEDKDMSNKLLCNDDYIVKQNKEILSLEEVNRMIYGIKRSRNIRRDKALISLLYKTTRRNAEIRGINLVDINWETRELTTLIKGKKGSKRQFIQIVPKETLRLVKDYIQNERQVVSNITRDKRGSGKKGYTKQETKEQLEFRKRDIQKALFLNCEGNFRLGKDDLKRMLKERALEVAITKNVTPHTMRRSAITHMDKLKYTDKQIMDISGHREAKTIHDFYTIYNYEDKKKSIDNFDKATRRDINHNEEEQKKKPFNKEPDEVMYVKTKQSDKDKQIEMLKLQLQVKEKELELEKAKSQNNNHMYG